ncbi:outer mitochondrial membrane cytochrome B5, partial [Metschnikowia bicuspidata var. bicuspidata NRRL YB-4993]
YTLAEVKQHGSPDDLWMILYNRVYDFTAFSAQHPGGAEVLFDCGGVDATEAFEDVGHSKNACEMLAPFLLGRVPKNDEK